MDSSAFGPWESSGSKGFAFAIVLAIVATIAGAVLYPACTGSTRRTNAEKQAQEYAQQLYPGLPSSVVCQAQDTDSNGYLSCTLRAGTQVVPIECADYYMLDWNHGCRPARAVIQTTQNGGGQ